MTRLHTELETLNPEQKQAVSTATNTVVLAGPGSGKTATLVLKAGFLLSEVIDAPRGLACITYNNEAAGEFRRRLESLGIRGSSRLFLGTIHSFCLSCVNRPFLPLAHATATEKQVASEIVSQQLLSKASAQIGTDLHPYDLPEVITRLRSRIACEEDCSGFADTDFKILDAYNQALEAQQLIDFSGIVENALELITANVWARDLLISRFPWLLVDEYQDLGGPLHKIVMVLANSGMRVFAVGDPDQSIYEFAGAQPECLISLSKRRDFRVIRLRFNYRSGQRLINASQAALKPTEPRDYKADPKRLDSGEVLFFKGDSIDDHAAVIANEVIPEFLARKFSYGGIALFYKRKGDFLSAVIQQLEAAGVPFLLDRHDKFPKTRITRWLQQLVTAGLDVSSGSVPAADLDQIEHTYRDVRIEAGLSDWRRQLSDSVQLFAVLSRLEPQAPLAVTVDAIDRELQISASISAGQDLHGDRQGWAELQAELKEHGALAGYTTEQFGSEGRPQNKVTLTTHHSSKGRQFDAVIIPELIQEVFPAAPWNASSLRRERRLFYVAFTRARHAVALVYGSSYRKRDGTTKKTEASQFAIEISNRLKQGN